MSVALSQRPLSRLSIGPSLPWAGLGLCLTVLLAHVAYDVFAHAHTPAVGKSDRWRRSRQSENRRPAVGRSQSRNSNSRRPRSRSSRRGLIEWRPASRSSG